MEIQSNNLQLQVKWDNKLKLPCQENTIYIDIETDPGHRIWLIGVLYDFQLHQFIAHSPEEEPMIILRFKEFLENYQYVPIMCYSGTYFDFRILLNRAKFFGIDLLVYFSNRPWMDLCIELNKVSSWPISLKLKELARFYQYPLIHNLDGQEISFLYADRIEEYSELDDNFREIALEYNADDIMLIPFLITKFGDHVEEMKEIKQIELRDSISWIKTHVKLIHKKSNSITFFMSRSLEVDARNYLFNICSPPKIHVSKYHISFTWNNFARDVIIDFLSRFEDNYNEQTKPLPD